MFYIKNNNIFLIKKNNKFIDSLELEKKINLVLLFFSYINNDNIKKINKKELKIWFNKNKIKILDFYNNKNNIFFDKYIKDNLLRKKITDLFSYNRSIIEKLNYNNYFGKNQDAYNEFLKINNNLYNLINYLRKIEMKNFNIFFEYINIIIFPLKKSKKWN